MFQPNIHFLNFTISTFNDNPEPWALFFQDNATPQMEGLEELHNNIMFYLAVILLAASWMMLSIILNYRKARISNKYINHGTLVELIWIITPTLILVLIAFPSFKLLYLIDEIIDPSLVIYGKGHQWYWSYQYPDFTNNDEEFMNYYILFSENSDVGAAASNSGAGSSTGGGTWPSSTGGSSCSCGHDIPGSCSNCTYHIPVEETAGTLPIETVCCHCGLFGAECVCSGCNCAYHMYCLDFVHPESPYTSDSEDTLTQEGMKEVALEEKEAEGKGKGVVRDEPEPEGKGKGVVRDEPEAEGKGK